MMLSASAARMGCVKTTLRHIGKNHRKFSVASCRRELLLSSGKQKSNTFRASVALVSDVNRWKSTVAAYGHSADEETFDKNHDHAEAAKVRSTFSHEEAWMLNLGRGDNNEWLLGPRDPDEWFTGLKPTSCPGEFEI